MNLELFDFLETLANDYHIVPNLRYYQRHKNATVTKVTCSFFLFLKNDRTLRYWIFSNRSPSLILLLRIICHSYTDHFSILLCTDLISVVFLVFIWCYHVIVK